jgi:hypothetical protein
MGREFVGVVDGLFYREVRRAQIPIEAAPFAVTMLQTRLIDNGYISVRVERSCLQLTGSMHSREKPENLVFWRVDVDVGDERLDGGYRIGRQRIGR